MDSILLPILIAVAVAMMAWAIFAAAGGSLGGRKRKIQQRLVAETIAATESARLPSAITLRRQAPGLPGYLARMRFLEGLQRKLLQAYPDGTLSRFLLIASALGAAGLLLAGVISFG